MLLSMLLALLVQGAWALPARQAAAGGPSERLTQRSNAVSLPLRRRSAAASTIKLLENAPAGVDDRYFIPIEIGTPPQFFDCLLDTSTDSVVVASGCNSTACATIPQFKPNASSTFNGLGQVPNHEAFSIGNYTGYIGQDTIAVGTYNLTNQTFLVATEVPPFQDENGFNQTVACVFGASFGPIVANTSLADPIQNTTDNIFQNLASQQALPENRFGLYLGRAVDTGVPFGNSTGELSDPSLSNSELVLGGVNNSRINGQFTLLNNVNPNNLDQWLVQIAGMAINGSVLNSSAGIALIDTATTFIYAPAQVVRPIAKLLGATPVSTIDLSGVAETTYSMPCKINASMPPVGIAISAGNIFNLDVRDLVVPQINASNCRLAIAEGNTTGYILGVTALKNWYTSFEYSTSTGAVGFAKLAATNSNTSAVQGPGPVKPPRYL